MGEAKTANCQEETALVPKLCTSQSVTIKPCSVLLKNISREINEKHECCLIQPNVKKLPQRKQSKRQTDVIKKLKVILCDRMRKSSIEKLQKPLRLQNAETLRDAGAKENQMGNGLELDHSANIPVLCSGEADRVETDDEGRETESNTRSLDISTFCDVGIFTKLSVVESNSGPTEEGTQTQVNDAFQHIDEDDDPGWFLVEIDEVIEVADPAACCLTNEANVPRELDCGDAAPSSPGVGLPPPSESKSGCKPHPDAAATTIDVMGKGSEEEESQQPHWPHGVQMVCYCVVGKCIPGKGSVSGSSDVNRTLLGLISESNVSSVASLPQAGPSCEELCGQTVRLLGTPTGGNQEMPSLERLLDLEDAAASSSDEDVGLSASRRKEGKTHPAGTDWPKPSGLGAVRRAKKSRNWAAVAAPDHRSRLSQSQSRRKVMNALRDALQKRLDDSPDLSVQKNAVWKIAERVERALFKLFCCVDQHYKNKYRSLLFNLQSPDNQLLFRRVVLGDLTPERLVQMTSLEMAPKELAEWRASENKRVLEMIEREAQEAPRCCPPTKFTHKGIVEIHREADEDFQEALEPQSLDSPPASVRSPIVDRRPPAGDSDGVACAEKQVAVDGERGFLPPPDKSPLEQKENVSKRFHPNSTCFDGEERPLGEDSAFSPSVPKRPLRLEKQSRSMVVWKGLVQMFSLKQFAAKAHPVSGSSCRLSQALPLLLQSRGCILPEDVWAYLDSVWPAHSKAMAVIRFSPSLTRGLNPYNMLYSYLNNKQRYGIVDVGQVEMFLLPLAAFQPVPPKLRPLGGPGLDLCHPSLLLGLILPKQTPTGILAARPSSPFPKVKRKRVTFKDAPETRCFGLLPLQSEMETGSTRPPRQLPRPGLLGEKDEGPPLSPLLALPGGLLGAPCHEVPLAAHREDTALDTDPSALSRLLQSLSGSPWVEGQWSGSTPGSWGAQPPPARDGGLLCMDSDPSQAWSTLGLLSPGRPALHVLDEAANLLDALSWPHQLGAAAVVPPPCEVSPLVAQPIPCTRPAAEAPRSLLEETLALMQHVTQLQAQPPWAAALGLPEAPQGVGSAGSEFPPVQQDNDLSAQLQLLFSTLGGQAQTPAAIE